PTGRSPQASRGVLGVGIEGIHRDRQYMPAPGLLGSATCESAVGEEETGPGSCSRMSCLSARACTNAQSPNLLTRLAI
ncbi:MAG: hypothetical protein WBX00_23025, partial [Isosphaeraceae bacterium]